VCNGAYTIPAIFMIITVFPQAFDSNTSYTTSWTFSFPRPSSHFHIFFFAQPYMSTAQASFYRPSAPAAAAATPQRRMVQQVTATSAVSQEKWFASRGVDVTPAAPAAPPKTLLHTRQPSAAHTTHTGITKSTAAAVQAAALPDHIAEGRVIVDAAAPQLSVLDPLVKGGKIPVPLDRTFNTKGRADWLAGKFRRDLSVCCLFHKGRCHAAERCHQVHVDRDALTSIRQQYADVICCCKACGDTASASKEAEVIFQHIACGTLNASRSKTTGVSSLKFSADAAEKADAAAPTQPLPEVALRNIAFTVGLEELFSASSDAVRISADGVAHFSTSRVCRLHLRGCCKYGKDCRHLHLCTKLAVAFGAMTAQEFTAAFGTAAVAPAAPVTVMNTPVKALASSSSLPATPLTVSKPLVAVAVPPLKPSSSSLAPSAMPLWASKDVAVAEETLPAATATPLSSSLSLQAHQAAPKPLRAPAFLRANYPVLDQGSLRCASLPIPSQNETGADDLELTFRPFERLPIDLSPTYITAKQFYEFEASPHSSNGSTTSAAARRKLENAATLESPYTFVPHTVVVASPMTQE
jgi:hypothetical protein